MPVFTFDEDDLVAGMESASLDVLSLLHGASIDPLSVHEPFLTFKTVEDPTGEYHDAHDSDQELSELPKYEGLRIPATRRRSSVYSRLSVSARSAGIAIPLGLGTHDRKTLADFAPLKVLGQGAYGKVHLVKDKYNGKLYAQKQIRKPQIDVLEQLAEASSPSGPPGLAHASRTIAERQILAQITHHDNIVKLFYALQDDSKFYLLMEYIPGGELFHHLTTNNSLGNVFLEEHTAFYAAEMALGLRHLHGLGIVYRDLKPENCLLNARGHLVLTDFGLSKAIGEDAECRLIIGTPEYMAPEIMKGEAYGYAVDWWLLGCVIYDMMVGKPPFTGKSHAVIVDKIKRSKPNLPFYLSLDAKDLLRKLLQKDPAKRLAVDAQWKLFQEHRFFRKIEWHKVEMQLATPPIVPVITSLELAENFSLEFTGMKISNYDLAPGQTADTVFQGFSYLASHSFIDRYKH